MKKKVFILMFYMGLLDLLLLACCPGPYYPHLQINNVLLENVSAGGPLARNASILNNDFALLCKFESSMVAAKSSLPVGSLGMAYASFNCPYDGEMGLKSQITHIEVTASTTVLGIDAGESLNQKDNIKVHRAAVDYFDSNVIFSVEQWVGQLNSYALFTLEENWYLKFDERITAEKPLKFRITFFYEDGTSEIGETDNISIN